MCLHNQFAMTHCEFIMYNVLKEILLLPHQVNALLSEGLNRPRKGNDAGDHPPITPMRSASEAELGASDRWSGQWSIIKHKLNRSKHKIIYGHVSLLILVLLRIQCWSVCHSNFSFSLTQDVMAGVCMSILHVISLLLWVKTASIYRPL